ncbi:MAG: asparagine synthase (glutamine-hydrolyzing) [Sphingobacteriales bacterium]|nr:asparagine synthase (glutamine-hydrolyzing) [Sphingobacteriales bacterium]MBI3720842.1 asparagine synthase (glutamine-hydrolyzing) [Sphingobacteriales bacterium]
MCGICGIIKFDGTKPDQQIIGSMMQSIKHRGPNDQGSLLEDNMALGFVRLSIIDLSSLGHQPMYSADKRYAIIFNGEVYNYIELRKELEQKGYKFISGTDTEVLLNSYIEWGEDCLHRFNGMWAFAIYDHQNKELFCARDRFGVKPFYYTRHKNNFAFASEIPAILTAIGEKPHADTESVFDYMVYNRTDQSDKTFFKEIKKLPHGHTLKIQLQTGDIKIRRWYDLRTALDNSKPFESTEAFKETFNSAVGLRLRSDVPVGVCLSGGLDSSSIVSTLLKEFGTGDLNTFSAVYQKGQKGDETEFINEYRSSIKNMHFIYPTAESFYKDLPEFICTHAEPFPTTSIYAHYKVMEMAKQHVVVTLDGQGADEELAGYHYFFGFYYKELFKQFRWVKLLTEIKDYWSNYHSSYAFKSFAYFLMPSGIKTALRVNEKGYLSNNFSNLKFESVVATELYNSPNLQAALFNHFEYKLEHLLKWQDLNSMRFSIEARVPFLDYRLVQGLLTNDSGKLISKGITKRFLREAMTGVLPEKIRMRMDKVGFETPQDEWFRMPMFREYIKDILYSDSFRKRDIIDAEKAKKLYQQHLDGKKDISKEIWKWINLELWYRRYID